MNNQSIPEEPPTGRDGAPKKKRTALVAGIAAAALVLGGGGIALGVNAAQASAYDAAVQEHNAALAELVDVQNALPRAEALWVQAWADSYAEKAVAIGKAPEAVIGKKEAAAVAGLGKRLAELDEGQPETAELAAHEEAVLDESKLLKTIADGGSRSDREAAEKARDAVKTDIAAVNAELDSIEEQHDALDAALAAGAPALADAARSALGLQGKLVEASPKADAAALKKQAAELKEALEAYEGDGAAAPEAEAADDEKSLAVDADVHSVDDEGLYDAQALASALDAYVKGAAALQKAHTDAVAAEQAAAEAAAAQAAAEAAAAEQWADPGYGGGYDDNGWNDGGGNSGGGGGGWTPPVIPPTACEATNTCVNNNI